MKIYTKRGDRGETDLLGGARVPKDHARVAAYGAVDELSAQIGVAAATTRHADLRRLAEGIQERLFEIGAYLASPDAQLRAKSGIAEPTADDVAKLEGHIDAFEHELEPLRRFVLPGGHVAAAAFHVARTVCRRAEREAVALHRSDPLGVAVLTYLNRLSDLLFVLARVENRRAGIADVEWSPRR